MKAIPVYIAFTVHDDAMVYSLIILYNMHPCSYLSGNTPPCEAEFLIRLCPFLEEDDATLCTDTTTEGTELLTIHDVCFGKHIEH